MAGQLTVPIYQGGAEYATIRQAKETLGQRRIDLDTARDQVAADAGAVLGPARSRQGADPGHHAQVNAAEIALNGVREEARVGQRTTLDVLNAQQELVNARVALVTAQRDRVVASYALLAAVGRLSPQVLGLDVPVYDPDGALPSGARHLGRRAHAGRQVSRVDRRARAPAIRAIHKAALAFANRRAILATIRVNIEWADDSPRGVRISASRGCGDWRRIRQ